MDAPRAVSSVTDTQTLLMKRRRRKIHGDFATSLQHKLKKTYMSCSNIIGRGAFDKIIQKILKELKRQNMLETSSQQLADALNGLKPKFTAVVEETSASAVKKFQQDFEMVFKRGKKYDQKQLAKARKCIEGILATATLHLNRALDSTHMDVDVESYSDMEEHRVQER